MCKNTYSAGQCLVFTVGLLRGGTPINGYPFGLAFGLGHGLYLILPQLKLDIGTQREPPAADLRIRPTSKEPIIPGGEQSAGSVASAASEVPR